MLRRPVEPAPKSGHSVSALVHCFGRRLFQRDHGGGVDLNQHARPSELADSQQRVSGHRCRPKSVLPTLAKIGLIPNVGHVSYHLHDVAKRCPVLFKRTFDLVEGVFALRCEVALVENVSALAIFILGANAGEKYHFARTSHRHCLGESSFSPFAVVVVFLFEGLGWRYRRHDGKRKHRKGSKGDGSSHVTTSLTKR